MRWHVITLLIFLGLLGTARANAEEEYRLAPQDKIAVTVLRHAELSQSYTIPPDGVIDFPRVGRLLVTGKTTREVAEALAGALGNTLRDPDVTVVLLEVRRRHAHVLGAVARPGQYQISPGDRITELLAVAGDLAGERERLTASLVRGAVTMPVDLQAALNGANPAANMPIQEGDVLWIQPPAMITVVVSGQVKNPGAVKLYRGSTILDALAQAGDLIGERERLTVSISRGTETLPVDLPAALAGIERGANSELRDGDLLLVLAPNMITVVVTGQVRTPGMVRLEQGSRLLDALAKAGDLVGERETLSATLTRQEQTTPVNLQGALSGLDRAANIALRDGDFLLVHAPPTITVSVSGQVKQPSVLRLREDATLVDALTKAGDLTERPDRVRITLVRDGTSQTLTWGDTTTTLRHGDVIFVEREAMVRVYVNGHVKAPGAYDLLAGGGVLEAIALSGGVLENPALAQVTVMRAGGEIERIDLTAALTEGNVTINPQLRAGDQVIVPESTARIAVLGMVRRPGTFNINEGQPLTVVDAIGLAGGEERRAKLSHVAVIRVVDNAPQRLRVDVNAVLRQGRFEANIALQANDIVFVPETNRPNWDNILLNLSRIGIVAGVL